MPGGSRPFGSFSQHNTKGHNMAQRIKIDLEPDEQLTFDGVVDIPTADGKGLKVTFTFKHRDREALAALSDDHLAKARAAAAAQTEQAAQAVDTAATSATLVSDSVRTTVDNEVQYILDAAVGWNIDAPFDAAHVRKLCVKHAGTAMAVMTHYRVSLTQGRLGN